MARRALKLCLLLSLAALWKRSAMWEGVPFVGPCRQHEQPRLVCRQGPVEAFQNGVARGMAEMFVEQFSQQLWEFVVRMERGFKQEGVKDRKFKLQIHADPNHGEKTVCKFWRPFKTPLAEVFLGLDYSITSFEMKWVDDAGDTFVLSGEEDFEDLRTESSNETLVINVHLKQPSVMDEIKNKASQIVKHAKHVICGGGQVKQEHVSLAEQKLTCAESGVTKMEAKQTALSQENFDIEAFPEQVAHLAEKLNMSVAEKNVLAMAPHLESQGSYEIKTYYDDRGNLVKRLTSWRTIRTEWSGKPTQDPLRLRGLYVELQGP